MKINMKNLPENFYELPASEQKKISGGLVKDSPIVYKRRQQETIYNFIPDVRKLRFGITFEEINKF